MNRFLELNDNSTLCNCRGKFHFPLVIFIVSLMLSAPSAQACHEGRLNISFRDSSRNKDVDAIVYYNADKDSGEAQTLIGTSGNVIPLFSVVALGHGYQIPWSCYHAQAYNIILNFYTQVVIVPKTGDGAAPNHMEFARDMVACLKYMQDEGKRPGSLFYGHIKNDNTLMGHSMGGGCAVLAAKYAVQNTNLNISSLILLAPAETTPSAVASCAFVQCPTLVICGDKDCITPPSTTTQPMYDAIPTLCKSMVLLTGGSHCQFADTNTLCSVAELGCRASISRLVQQNRSFSYINYLLKRSDTFTWYIDNAKVTTAMTVLKHTDLEGTKTKACVGDTITVRSKVTLPNYLWLPDSVRTPTYTFIAKQGINTIALVNTQCLGTNHADFSVSAGVAENVTLQGGSSLCIGDSTVVEMTNGALTDVQWSTGEHTRSITIRNPGTYTVKGYDVSACAWSEKAFTVIQIPFVQSRLTRSGDTSFCEGMGEVTVECNVDTTRFKGYLWSTGETTPYIVLRKNGTYNIWVRVHPTISYLCDAMSDTMKIELHEIIAPKPTLTRSGNTLLASEADTYAWYKSGVLVYDAKARSFTPFELGMYSVQVSYHAYGDCVVRSEEYNFDQRVDVTQEPENTVRISLRDGTLLIEGTDIDEYVRLFSLIGSKVSEQRSSASDVRMDCGMLTDGLYYLQFSKHEKVYSVHVHK